MCEFSRGKLALRYLMMINEREIGLVYCFDLTLERSYVQGSPESGEGKMKALIEEKSEVTVPLIGNIKLL